MRIRTSIGIAILLLAGSTFVSGQKSTGTIYLYRLDRDFFLYSFVFNRTLSVRFGKAEGTEPPKELPKIAGLRNKRYFKMELEPGRYWFDTRMHDGKLEIEVEAGDERYIRFDAGKECPSEDEQYAAIFGPSCETRPAGLYLTFRREAVADIVRTKPIKKGDIDNHSLVTIPK